MPPSESMPCASGRSVAIRPLLVLALLLVAAGSLFAGHRADAQTTTSPSAPTIAPAALPAADDAAARKAAAKQELSVPKAVALGVIEGFTEFLPVSSSGHLLVAEKLLGIGATDTTKEAADAYAIVIQGGAILAVLLVYWKRVLQVFQGLLGKDTEGRQLLICLVIGFLPAAVVGVLFEKKIKSVLFAPWPIVVSWVVGGIVILVLSRSGRLSPERKGGALASITYQQAAIIGAAQCLALWPGTSRSLVTIAAAALVGLSLAASVEFSFLLGLVTLGAATAYDTVKSGKHIVANYGIRSPTVGFVFALIAGFVAVKWMIGYLQHRSFAVFGWYRLAIAAATAGLILAGTI